MAAKKNKNEMSINLEPDVTPVLYTDNILITVNEDGVVLDFGQNVGSTNSIQVVTRAGMSKTHARKLVNELGNLLLMAEGQISTGERN
ncbi:hypothetical protein KBA63_04105 [Candidatus Woesebacteria bacterium]|jgi:hypothetical protein|nr:hypothetical protein [Candidatus Woesebacteria bacterium]